LAGGDATKIDEVSEINVHEAFFYLAYEQDKAQAEKQLINKHR
jgi:hypothetical protein